MEPAPRIGIARGRRQQRKAPSDTPTRLGRMGRRVGAARCIAARQGRAGRPALETKQGGRAATAPDDRAARDRPDCKDCRQSPSPQGPSRSVILTTWAAPIRPEPVQGSSPPAGGHGPRAQACPARRTRRGALGTPWRRSHRRAATQGPQVSLASMCTAPGPASALMSRPSRLCRESAQRPWTSQALATTRAATFNLRRLSRCGEGCTGRPNGGWKGGLAPGEDQEPWRGRIVPCGSETVVRLRESVNGCVRDRR
jgi:hypothetical protein